MHDGNNSVSE